MCLNPINILNPTKRIAICGGVSLRNTVACGKCAHCLTRKRDEYSFRTYWHTKDTLDKGGYVIFDTLTYSNKYLPHISDHVKITKEDKRLYGLTNFSCFSREHYKLFFKRLRKAIFHRYGLNDVISYFLTTEYGDDDRYTHRPHYHVLIFVKTNRIHPLWLSRRINSCWQYGRTDGIVYKPLKYVAKHIYGYDLGFGDNSQDFVLRAVTHYVAKYITKSCEFTKELDNRFSALYLKLSHEENIEEKLKTLRRYIDLFHMQSKGYGLGYLNYLDEAKLYALKEDTCLIPDQSKVTKSLPLPMYYIRKLYYNCIKVDDKYVWRLNENGINHKIDSYFPKLRKLNNYYEDLFANCTPQQKSYIVDLLNGRSLLDYSIYLLFYRGKLRDYRSVNYFTSYCDMDLNSDEHLDTWLLKFIKNNKDIHLPTTEIMSVDDDNNVHISHYYGDTITELDPVTPYSIVAKRDFCKLYTFNEKSSPKFKDFDLLTQCFDKIIQYNNRFQQSDYEYKRDLNERIKPIYKTKS